MKHQPVDAIAVKRRCREGRQIGCALMMAHASFPLALAIGIACARPSPPGYRLPCVTSTHCHPTLLHQCTVATTITRRTGPPLPSIQPPSLPPRPPSRSRSLPPIEAPFRLVSGLLALQFPTSGHGFYGRGPLSRVGLPRASCARGINDAAVHEMAYPSRIVVYSYGWRISDSNGTETRKHEQTNLENICISACGRFAVRG